MGLFDRIKQERNEQYGWSINKKKGKIELNDKYVTLTTQVPKKEIIVFYKDVTNVMRMHNFITITTKTDEFKLAPMQLRGAEDAAKEVYVELLEKVSDAE